MCFRPAEISMNVCPRCGASNKPVAKVCAQCGAELKKMEIDFDADQAKLDAAATAAPGAPKAPKAPGAPGAPRAPKPPAPTAPPPNS